MKLTAEMAARYVAYRERYFGGTLGTYLGHPCKENTENRTSNSGSPYDPDPCSNANKRRYRPGDSPAFMIVNGDPLVDTGTFLHADAMSGVKRDENVEEGPIKEITFGDNLIYASITMTMLVAEHAITGLPDSLKVAIGIAKSFQRLGGYQRGLGELGEPPFGYMLRHDSHDESKPRENICRYGDGATVVAKQLAPSFDQYATTLSCAVFAKRILAQSESDKESDKLRRELVGILKERCQRSLEYLAFNTEYSIRWKSKKGSTQTPETHRGPYCHHAALPFARCAAYVCRDDADEDEPYLGNLTLALIPDFATVFVAELVKALDDIEQRLALMYEEQVLSKMSRAQIKALKALLDLSKYILDKFHDVVLPLIRDQIISPIAKRFRRWNGVLPPALNTFVAHLLFDLFAHGMLSDTSDFNDPFKDKNLTIKLRDLLPAIDPIRFPEKLTFKVTYEFDPPKPSWWSKVLFGPFNFKKFDVTIVEMNVELESLLDLEIEVPLTSLLNQLASLGNGHEYLQFHAYNLLSASNLFNQTGFDAADRAFKYDNAWYMALAHRFHGANIQDFRVSQILGLLESAPLGFPNAYGVRNWNQDFRWLRRTEELDEDNPKIYGGLDFMAPLMIACSDPADIKVNRDVLLEELVPKNQGDEMDIIRLPFQCPLGEVRIYIPDSNMPVTMLLWVVFDRPKGSATLTLEYGFKDKREEITFNQNDGVSQLHSLVIDGAGISVKQGSGNARGAIMLKRKDE